MPSAQLLVTWDTVSRKFTLNPASLAYIRSLPSPISVVAVAGLYRTGKSYLINRVFLNSSQAFEVGPSVNPCTKGIWIWTEPITCSQPDGSPCTLLLLDTEGIGGLDKDSDYDSRIFSIAALLSSVFVYNSTGPIDENAIENIGLVVNLSRILQAGDPSAFFPRLIWVLRDFTLQLESEGKDITANDYLEKTLMPQKGFSDSAENKNRIRKTLKEFFRDRECVTMVRPTVQEADLQRLDELDVAMLRKEFVEQAAGLRRKVVMEAKVKKIHGVDVTGELLAKLLEGYIEAFNAGAVPNIDSTWGYICKANNRKVLARCIGEYENMMGEVGIPAEDEEIESVHKEAKKAGIVEIEKTVIGDKKEVLTEFLSAVKEKYAEKKMQCQYEMKMYFMTFLKGKYTELDAEIRNGMYKSLQGFDKRLKLVEKEYYEECINGKMKAEIFLTFAREISNKAAEFLMNNLSEEVRVQKGINEDISAQYSNQLKEMKDTIAQLKLETDKQVSKLQAELSIETAKVNIYQENLEKTQKTKDDLEIALKELQKQKNNDVDELRRKIQENEEQFRETNRKTLLKVTEVEDEKVLLEQRL
jgi:hypothetical protein